MHWKSGEKEKMLDSTEKKKTSNTSEMIILPLPGTYKDVFVLKSFRPDIIKVGMHLFGFLAKTV